MFTLRQASGKGSPVQKRGSEFLDDHGVLRRAPTSIPVAGCFALSTESAHERVLLQASDKEKLREARRRTAS